VYGEALMRCGASVAPNYRPGSSESPRLLVKKIRSAQPRAAFSPRTLQRRVV
jgi:hypothetical protein